MDNKLKVAGLIAGGYLLGRTKKFKLAVTMAAGASGSALYRNREQIQGALSAFGAASPELAKLTDSAQGIVTGGVNRLSSSLQERTEKLNASMDDAAGTAQKAAESATGSQDEDSEDESEAPAEEEAPQEEEEASQDDAAEEETAQEETPEEDAEEKAEEKPKAAPRKRAPAKSSSAKSSTSKSTSSKSTSGGSKSSNGRKTPAKRSTSSTRKTSSTKNQGAKK